MVIPTAVTRAQLTACWKFELVSWKTATLPWSAENHTPFSGKSTKPSAPKSTKQDKNA